eukprot:4942461-Alexandrium_andersonii.AAC.1
MSNLPQSARLSGPLTEPCQERLVRGTRSGKRDAAGPRGSLLPVLGELPERSAAPPSARGAS